MTIYRRESYGFSIWSFKTGNQTGVATWQSGEHALGSPLSVAQSRMLRKHGMFVA